MSQTPPVAMWDTYAAIKLEIQSQVLSIFFFSFGKLPIKLAICWHQQPLYDEIYCNIHLEMKWTKNQLSVPIRQAESWSKKQQKNKQNKSTRQAAQFAQV